jgi:DNA polymerase V
MDGSIALITGKVPAGFPSPALDYAEERIDLTKILIANPLATFIIQCTGDSMVNAFIPPKALLVVDRSITPENGDIVVAVVNGEFTVKYLRKNAFKCWLVPGNRHYPEIEVTPEMNMQVWGVVTYIITDTKDVRQCMR